jgi:SAM-dependent methyltransferase
MHRIQRYRRGTYSDVALEYYNAGLHPTCANFREASQYFLAPWFVKLIQIRSRVLETGAGHSIVSDWLHDSGKRVSIFVASDVSLRMLSNSPRFGSGSVYCLCDAKQLPFANNSFDVIVSSLGDPYNSAEFWRETARVLSPGGHVAFTTPSFEWAQQYRNGIDFAEFVMNDGEVVTVPSRIEEQREQERLIECAGLSVVSKRHIFEYEIQKTRRSPKLRAGPIVSGYVARKFVE